MCHFGVRVIVLFVNCAIRRCQIIMMDDVTGKENEQSFWGDETSNYYRHTKYGFRDGHEDDFGILISLKSRDGVYNECHGFTHRLNRKYTRDCNELPVLPAFLMILVCDLLENCGKNQQIRAFSIIRV